MSSFGCKTRQRKIGVLIANLGTPDAPTPRALRKYLKEFLWDPRVIEVPRILWWLILHLFILVFRPKRSARLYSRIWWKDGSPLLKITEAQTKLIREKIKEHDPTIEVEFGMRYGTPSMESAVDGLVEKGCRRILLVPMYPQYAGATTGSTYDGTFAALKKFRWVPTLRVVEPYFNDKRYIEAQSTIIDEFVSKIPDAEKPQKLILSYHGIPQKYVDKGDPYCCMCSETTRALTPNIKTFKKEDIIHTYQSRFGKEPWLIPYTDRTIEKVAHEGIKRIAVALPGFTADCLETLDEIGNEGSESFHEEGGEKLFLIPCLNDHPAWINAISGIILDELGSWKDIRDNGQAFECPVVAARRAGIKA
jgi:ferrochelatase